MIYDYEDFKQELQRQYKTVGELQDAVKFGDVTRFIDEIAIDAIMIKTSELLTWYSEDPDRLEYAEMGLGNNITEKLTYGMAQILTERYGEYLRSFITEINEKEEEK